MPACLAVCGQLGSKDTVELKDDVLVVKHDADMPAELCLFDGGEGSGVG